MDRLIDHRKCLLPEQQRCQGKKKLKVFPSTFLITSCSRSERQDAAIGPSIHQWSQRLLQRRRTDVVVLQSTSAISVRKSSKSVKKPPQLKFNDPSISGGALCELMEYSLLCHLIEHFTTCSSEEAEVVVLFIHHLMRLFRNFSANQLIENSNATCDESGICYSRGVTIFPVNFKRTSRDSFRIPRTLDTNADDDLDLLSDDTTNRVEANRSTIVGHDDDEMGTR